MDETKECELFEEQRVARLASLCLDDARVKSEIIVALIEIEDRRIHLHLAYSSMMSFCTKRLGMSQNTAFLRIAAMRIARRFPCVLPAIGQGDLHLSTLVLLKHHLTASNAVELVAEVRGKSVREVRVLLAARAPKPDIATAIVPLVEQTVLPTGSDSGPRPDAPSRPVARIMPLSPERFGLQMTVGQEVLDKLERAKDLMRHRNPDGDLAVIVNSALDALLAKLEKEVRGKADRPRDGQGGRHGSISRATTREVFARDGEQCTFVAANGDRCSARGFLERDHIAARAMGGSGDASNIRVLCRPHNRLHAEEVFGREHMDRAIALGRGKSALAQAEAEAATETPTATRTVPAVSENEGNGSGNFGRPMYPDDPTKDDARALDGLVRLGFKRGEASRALETVRQRRKRAPGDLPDVLRDAIGLLT